MSASSLSGPSSSARIRRASKSQGTASANLGRMADRLALQRWGDDYEPHSGLVRFNEPQRLKADVSPLTERLLQDRHIAYFIERNPGHENGDELVCLASLATANLTAIGRRLLCADDVQQNLQQGVSA